MKHGSILITGVGQRVGLHLARTFLARGVPVIGTYRSERPALEELRSLGAELHFCDFYDETGISSLAGSINDGHESLRAIIHNASDWMPDNAGAGPEKVMQQMMQVHVSAPYQINLALAPLLCAHEGKAADIIHVGDYVSGRGSKKHIAYAASKAAQDNLTLSFAAKLAPEIKVNSLAPGLVLFNENDDAAYREKAVSKSLIRREGGLEEFLLNVDYLLNSDYVTGRIIHMDGGRHLV